MPPTRVRPRRHGAVGGGTAPRVPQRATGTRYDEFVRVVRQYRATRLLRLLARASIRQWHRRPLSLVNPADPIKPWAVSLVAREALAGGLAAQGRQTPTEHVLPALDAYVHELEDPLLLGQSGGAAGGGSLAGFMLRTGYQQFPYQQPIFGDTARMRPMLKRPFPRPRYQVLSDAVIEELLGADIDAYTDLAPFFLAAVMVNNGTFNPGWLDQPSLSPSANRCRRNKS
jgi:hypothetical protein